MLNVLEGVDTTKARELFETNVLGEMAFTQAVLPGMRAPCRRHRQHQFQRHIAPLSGPVGLQRQQGRHQCIHGRPCPRNRAIRHPHTACPAGVSPDAGESFADPRISAGVLLAAPGRGGSEHTAQSAARFPFFDVDFARMTTRSLVVCGANDDPHFTSRGPEWHADAFHHSPGVQALVTVHDVGHGLGGIAGLDAKETEIEAPDSLEATRRLSLSWFRTALEVDVGAWLTGIASLDGPARKLAHVTIADNA